MTLKQQYIQFMDEYENLGHMSVSKIPDSEVKYFIPHRCVLRPDSSSTKLRVVFNASCPTSSKISLNDALMVGPTIQNELYDIVIRFRSYKYALTADISKMYRQIWMSPEDRSCLGILWREEPTQPVKTYLLNTVTYGTASAPFQATRCLKALAQEHAHEFPMAAKVIQENFYVDDMISGTNTLEELFELKNQVQYVLSKGRFQLRKWSSNSAMFLDHIPEDDRESTLKIEGSDIIKTLGLIWNPSRDEFQFTWRSDNLSNKITKRSILSCISSLFDPLGLISPCIIPAKLIMQKLDWDESLPATLHNEWLIYRNQLPEVSEIRIQRYIYLEPLEQCELHGFADASMQAYGCCVYIRCQSVSGNISINLVSSKSRVAPLKTQSLPRLELCAALLLAKLLNRIRKHLRSIMRVILWTDSQITLHWIRDEPSSWATFVGNRVSQIQQLTEKEWWHHVPSEFNAADLISRGCSVQRLMESKWFTGPDFLQQAPQHWPTDPLPLSDSKIPDKRKSKSVLVTSHLPDIDIVATNTFVNDFSKLRRIFAYLLRFISHIKMRLQRKGKLSNSSPDLIGDSEEILTPTELAEAERRIIYHVQNQVFKDDIKTLSQDREINSKSPLKSLCPFLDEGKPPLLRVGGRLAQSNLPYKSKFPIVLPKNHPLSLSILTHLHRKFLHAGTQSLRSF